MDQVDQSFSKIYNMFGPTTGGGGAGATNPFTGAIGGGGSGPFGLQPQPLAGADNDLTAYLRSVGNLMGQFGPATFQTGGNVLGTGLGTTQGGVDIMGQGLSTMQPSVDFYSKILSGDPTAVTAALAPTAANISQITAGTTNQAAQGMPQGGYRAATLAGLPFSQAAQVGNAALGLQPAAAQALASIGGEQAQIGQGIAGVGTNIGQLGTTLTSQGLSALNNLISALLSKNQINVSESGNLLSALI
jgi:hypothetical protein